MAEPLQLVITEAGLDALVNAQAGNTAAIEVTEVALTADYFVAAPTLTAIPNEIKRLQSVAGQPVDEFTIHMVARDESEDVYDLRGIGLILGDGTVFATYAQVDPLFSKVDIANFLFAFDIRFANSIATSIVFGDVNFLYPPARETVQGVAELATQAETDEGTDDERIVTPLKLKNLLDVIRSALDQAEADIDDNDNDITNLGDDLAALIARTITGGGLVTGGGNLSQSRVLTVPKASSADVLTETDDAKALTAQALAGLPRSLAQNGHVQIPGCGGLRLQWGRFTAAGNATTAVVFPISFSAACFSVLADGVISGGTDSKDNPPGVVTSTITASGFSVFNAEDSATGCSFIAIGQ